MNAALPIIASPASAILLGSIYSFLKERTVWRFLQLFGATCLIVVVLTHLAEALDVLPALGWGQDDSAGHYLDLASAILGCALLPTGFVAATLGHRKERGADHG
jgi:hypothetical protein